MLNSRKENYFVHLLIFARPLTWYGEQDFGKTSSNMVYKVDASMSYWVCTPGGTFHEH